MGYDMQSVGVAGDTGYFQKNIWGMRLIRDIMEAFNMGSWFDGPPPYPKLLRTLSDADRDRADKLVSQVMGMDDSDAVAALVAGPLGEAVQQKLFWLSNRKGEGVALHKLSSNDGWWVTPDECREAVAAYERATNAHKHNIFTKASKESTDPDWDAQAWFEGWVDYLRQGVSGKGFRVW